MIKAALLYSLLASPTLLEGVDIHYPDGRIDTAMHIAFDGSQIISISKAKPKLSDATVIDARGKILIPGIIESVSQLGLMEVGMVESTNDYGIESESPLIRASIPPSLIIRSQRIFRSIGVQASHILSSHRAAASFPELGEVLRSPVSLRSAPSFVLKRRYSRGLEPELRKASVAHEPRSGERLKKLSATHATPNAMPDY